MTEAGGGAARPAPVAEALGVAKRFGATQALIDVSLRVEAGESHALVGRNGAGKSTLVAVLTGLVRPDEGELRLGGEPAPPLGAREAWQERVACVYQRSTIVPTLTVAENLYLNRQPTRRGAVSWSALRAQAREELAAWDIDVDPDQDAARLSVEERQLVEIARALSRGTRFIILDEPTAQLDAREIARLFERVRALQEAGITFLYISHHLEEIYEVCTTVTVLRNGARVASEPVADMPKERVVAAMVGDAARATTAPVRAPHDAEARGRAPVLEVEGLGSEGRFSEVSFALRAGECVGLAGQVGSGKTWVGDAIAGLVGPLEGEVRVDGRRVEPGRVDRAVAAGVGYVPEDRHERGYVPYFSVEENSTLSVLRRLVRRGVIDTRARRRAGERLIEDLAIRTSSPGQLVSELSGGNQQKVVMGRALASEPRVLVLIRPTAGVDIASKEALFETVRRACADGAAALLVTDELDELALCDRVLVMWDGRLVHELGAERSEDELVAAMEGVGVADAA